MKKKLFYSAFMLLCSLSLLGFTPSDKTASYSDVSKNESVISEIEVSKFTQSEKSEMTEDQTVWTKRHKTWTDLTASGEVVALESVLERN